MVNKKEILINDRLYEVVTPEQYMYSKGFNISIDKYL